jgi:hypothetical protein
MSSKKGHVYCYQKGSDNCYKVGHTKHKSEKRKPGISTGSDEKLTLCREIETENPSGLETYIHKLLDAKRAENAEYFRITLEEFDLAAAQATAFMQEAHPFFSKVKELRRKKPNDTLIEPSDEMSEAYRQIRRLAQERYFIDQRIKLLASKIQVAIGEAGGMNGIASWGWIERFTIDLERFKKEQEALFEQYKRDSSCRRFRLEKVDLTKDDGEGQTDD